MRTNLRKSGWRTNEEIEREGSVSPVEKFLRDLYGPGETNKAAVLRRALEIILWDIFQTLPKEKEKKVMEAIYLENKKPIDIAREMGLTRSRIGQIKQRALRKCRHPSRSIRLKDFWDVPDMSS